MYFNDKHQLIFDGYDIGTAVEEAWGDADYEYTYTIEPGEADKFYQIFNVQTGDKAALLQSIKGRFGVNKAYSLLGAFMKENDIKYEGSTWA